MIIHRMRFFSETLKSWLTFGRLGFLLRRAKKEKKSLSNSLSQKSDGETERKLEPGNSTETWIQYGSPPTTIVSD